VAGNPGKAEKVMDFSEAYSVLMHANCDEESIDYACKVNGFVSDLQAENERLRKALERARDSLFRAYEQNSRSLNGIAARTAFNGFNDAKQALDATEGQTT
jgi:hypothetical protein